MLRTTKYISVDFIPIASARSCSQEPALGHMIKYVHVGSLGELT